LRGSPGCRSQLIKAPSELCLGFYFVSWVYRWIFNNQIINSS